MMEIGTKKGNEMHIYMPYLSKSNLKFEKGFASKTIKYFRLTHSRLL